MCRTPSAIFSLSIRPSHFKTLLRAYKHDMRSSNVQSHLRLAREQTISWRTAKSIDLTLSGVASSLSMDAVIDVHVG